MPVRTRLTYTPVDAVTLTRLPTGSYVADFGRVYATILEGWLGLPSATAAGGTFERLPLFGAE